MNDMKRVVACVLLDDGIAGLEQLIGQGPRDIIQVVEEMDLLEKRYSCSGF